MSAVRQSGRCRPELAAGGIDVLAPAVPDHGHESVVQQHVPECIDPFLVGPFKGAPGKGLNISTLIMQGSPLSSSMSRAASSSESFTPLKKTYSMVTVLPVTRSNNEAPASVAREDMPCSPASSGPAPVRGRIQRDREAYIHLRIIGHPLDRRSKTAGGDRHFPVREPHPVPVRRYLNELSDLHHNC